MLERRRWWPKCWLRQWQRQSLACGMPNFAFALLHCLKTLRGWCKWYLPMARIFVTGRTLVRLPNRNWEGTSLLRVVMRNDLSAILLTRTDFYKWRAMCQREIEIIQNFLCRVMLYFFIHAEIQNDFDTNVEVKPPVTRLMRIRVIRKSESIEMRKCILWKPRD